MSLIVGIIKQNGTRMGIKNTYEIDVGREVIRYSYS